MSAYSEEWEDSGLEEIAKHLLKVSMMIFNHLDSRYVDGIYDVRTDQRKASMYEHLLYSLFHQHEQALELRENYEKRYGYGKG